MVVDFRFVSGSEFASKASEVLSAAWQGNSFHYTPEYIRWQLTFPGPTESPAVAAFVGSTPAGFAACSHRRFHQKERTLDCLLVSFVAVHPDFRNQGIAAGLYRVLLTAIAQTQLVVITFAQVGSSGQRAILRAYPAASFDLQSIGTYPTFACKPDLQLNTEWVCEEHNPLHYDEFFENVVDVCAQDSGLLWGAPSTDQRSHCRLDPRPHVTFRLVSGTGAPATAVAVRNEYVAVDGVRTVASIASVSLSRNRTDLLPSLVTAVARWWPDTHIVTAPNLAGFDEQQLRKAGFRHVSAGFLGYIARPQGSMPLPVCATNIEIV